MKKILIILTLVCLVFLTPKISFSENQTTIEINELSAIGISLLQQGKFHDALEYFDKILIINPNDMITLGNKGAALTQLNRHEEALALYNKVLEMDPRNINVLNNMAASLFELGRINKSLQTLDKILEVDPNNVEILILKGKVFFEAKRYNEAFVILNKALEIDPLNEDAKKQSYFAIRHIQAIPITDSKYLGHVILQLRNSQGGLVSVTVSDVLGYLPLEITDQYLNSVQVKEIVIINGKKYEKRDFTEIRHATKQTFIGMSALTYDKLGYDIYPFDVLPNGITIEKGDVLRADWTIFREIDYSS